MAGRSDRIDRALDDGAVLVLTDSNRRRARRWGTVRENSGYTERAGEEPLEEDPGDNRLPVFTDAGDDAYTVARHVGVQSVAASGYGNPVTYTPEHRAAHALDGDTRTAWRVAAFSPVQGERLRIDFDGPVTTNRINLVQPLNGPRNRWITRLKLRFDGDDSTVVDLTDQSRQAHGQTVTFPTRTFRQLELVVDDDNIGKRPAYGALSAVGFAEVRIPGVRMQEILRLPTDLLAAAGERSAGHPLTVLLARARSNPAEPVRSDEEIRMIRAFELPTARSFRVAGTARLSADAPDQLVDELLGISPASKGGLTVRTDSRLPGSLAHRSSAALDGDPKTSWSADFHEQRGHWIEVTLPQARTLDRLDLRLVADGRHSVPTRLRIETDTGSVREFDVPPVADGADEYATVKAPVRFRPVRGRKFRVTVADVRETKTIDYYSEAPTAMPVAIAELGMPGVRRPRPPARLPRQCREDLVTVDGRPVGVRLAGTPAAAVARDGVAVEPCDDDARLRLGATEHVVRTGKGYRTGIDVDRLVLRSAAGGDRGSADEGEGEGEDAPRVEVLGEGRASYDLEVAGADRPFWLVLGQSHNDGWQATVDGQGSRGAPELIDGYANGWYVDPAAVGDGPLQVTLRWTPQRIVWVAFALAAIAIAVCVYLIVRDPGRRGRPMPPATGGSRPFAVSPLTSTGTRPPWREVALGALTVGGLAALLVHPLAGLAVAAVAVGAMLWPSGRALLLAGAVGGIGLAAAYTIVRQFRNDFPHDSAWPEFFHVAHLAAWIGVCLLATDIAVSWLRNRRTRSRRR